MYVIIETRKQKRMPNDDFTVLWTIPCRGFTSKETAQDYLKGNEIFKKLLSNSKQHWKLSESSNNHLVFVNEYGSILMDYMIKPKE